MICQGEFLFWPCLHNFFHSSSISIGMFLVVSEQFPYELVEDVYAINLGFDLLICHYVVDKVWSCSSQFFCLSFLCFNDFVSYFSLMGLDLLICILVLILFLHDSCNL